MRDCRTSWLLLAFALGCSSEGPGAGPALDAAAMDGGPTPGWGADTAATDAPAPPAPGGVCAPGCVVAADCCPVGLAGCPGEYPNAWECEAGVCKAGGCKDTGQCRPGGDFERFSCHALSGVGSCFEPCTDDRECAAIPDSTCAGLADDGARFCKVTAGCTSDAACAGYGRCDLTSGECRCDVDAECRALPGLVCAGSDQP